MHAAILTRDTGIEYFLRNVIRVPEEVGEIDCLIQLYCSLWVLVRHMPLYVPEGIDVFT